MNNNDNINNQSGNNSTTFNANKASYNEQKNAAQAKGNSIKNKAMSKGEDLLMKKGASVLAKTGPWGAAAAAGLKALQASKKASEAEGNGKGTALGNNIGGAIANKALGGKSALDLAKGAKGVAGIGKLKTLKIKLIILGSAVGLLLAGFGIACIYELKNQIIEDTGVFFEKYRNLASTGKFETNQKACYDEISKVDSNLDDGILLATVENSAIRTPELWDEKTDDSTTDSTDSGWDSFSTLMGYGSAPTFYQVKYNMLKNDTYSMIDALTDTKLYLVRVKYDTSKDSDYSIYINSGYKPLTDVASDITKNILFKSLIFDAKKADKTFNNNLVMQPQSAFRITSNFLNDYVSFKKQGSNVMEYEFNTRIASMAAEDNEFLNFLKKIGLNDLASVADSYSIFSKENMVFGYGFEEEDEAGLTYRVLAKEEVVNNYSKFYDYISYVYVPTLYSDFWKSKNVTDADRNNLVRDVWDDIVIARNEYYLNSNVYDELYYSFDELGNITTSYSGSVYIGNLPTTEAAKQALSWKQFDSRWGSYRIGNKNTHTMHNIGCLVTSIAKIAAISGTEIDSDTFDPGVLATNLTFENGDLVWRSDLNGKIAPKLLPNFRRVNIGSGYVSIPSTSSDVSGELANQINKSGYTGSKYYYTFHIQYSGGTHFIAIVGSDENGFIVSDPTYGEDTYYLNNISNVINRTVVIKGFQVYEKMD